MKLTRRQKITIVILVPYWVAFFIAVHMPIPELVYRARVSDKCLHFLAYLNLIFLLWFSISPDRKVNWRKRMAWLIFFVVAAYGGLDELLQPYIGRTKDMGDFLANVAGGAAGLFVFTFLGFWQSLLIVSAITIFGLTNLAKANLSELVPTLNAVFHIIAYAGFTLVWARLINLYVLIRAIGIRLAMTVAAPIALLIFVKISSLLLGRQFAITDLLFAVLGIAGAVVAAYLVGMRKRNYSRRLRIFS